MAADGPAFVAAAVWAACLAKAPRRTVQAVAASVAGVFAHQHASAKAATDVKVKPATQCTTGLVGHDENMPALIEALRSARRAQRQRKKERRRAAKAAAAVAPDSTAVAESAAATDTTAAEVGGAGTAIAPQAPAASSLQEGPPNALPNMNFGAAARRSSPAMSHGSVESLMSYVASRPPSLAPTPVMSPRGIKAAPPATSPRSRKRGKKDGAPLPHSRPGRPPDGSHGR
jgi:hypothetical protein